MRSKVTELKAKGFVVLKRVFDATEIANARNVVTANRSMFRNTRPSPSSGHIAAFHRYPELEELHVMLTSNRTIRRLFAEVYGSGIYRSIGLSDITVNRSQHWHADLLRGAFAGFLSHLSTESIWGNPLGDVFKVLCYLQSGRSLQVAIGSHTRPLSLKDDCHSETLRTSKLEHVEVEACDAVIMDIRCVHRGAEEHQYINGQWDENPRILVSTVTGRDDSDLTEAMELGNAHRLADWTRRHGAAPGKSEHAAK
jgi:hypothetical protein